MLPQPVLILGTYNVDGSANAMNAAWGGQWDAKEIMISMGGACHNGEPGAVPGVYRGFRYQGHYGGGGLRGHSQR